MLGHTIRHGLLVFTTLSCSITKHMRTLLIVLTQIQLWGTLISIKTGALEEQLTPLTLPPMDTQKM